MSGGFQVANCWKGGKIPRNMHLNDQKSCNLLQQLEKIPRMEKKVENGKCGKVLLPHFIVKDERKKNHFLKKVKSRGN